MTSWRLETVVGTRNSRGERLVDVRKAMESHGEILGQGLRELNLDGFLKISVRYVRGVQISSKFLTGTCGFPHI